MTTFNKSVQLTVLDQSVFTATNRLTAGYGGQGRAIQMRGTVTTASATDATTVFYRMVRVPTNAVINKVSMYLSPIAGATALPTITTLTLNVGMWASDAPAPGDGTSAWMLNYTTAAISDSFFAYHYDAHAGVAGTAYDLTFQNTDGNSVTDGYYTPDASVYPLWDAVENGGVGRVAVAGYAEKTQGNGYSSGSTAPWTSPANSGTILPAAGDPGGFVDIGFRNSSTMSASTAVQITMVVDMIYGAT